MLKQKREKKSLAETIAEEIRVFIKERQLLPGDKLPSELELMEALNVGRGTIREAVKLLVSRNVLMIKRGVGTYVSEHTGQIEDPLGFDFVEDKEKLILDTLQLRLWIEPNMAAEAARHASDEQITQLQMVCDKIEQCLSMGEDHTQADIEFHTLIANCTKNMVISNLIPIINAGVSKVIKMSQSILKEETIATHKKILSCIAQHDVSGAYEAMEEHIQHNLNLFDIHG